MEFGLSDDQKLLGDMLGKALADISSLDAVRGAMAVDETDRAAIRAQMAGLGIPALVVPEAYGGMGLGLLDAALAAERLGAVVAPFPFAGTSVMAPIALIGAGSAAQKAAWLPRIATGDAVIGVAVSEQAAGARNGAGVIAKAGRLSGRARFVIDGAGADAFIIADSARGLHLVAADALGLSIEPVATIDATRPIVHLAFDNVAAEPFDAAASELTLARMIDAGRVMLAADTLGAAGVMIGKAVAYSLERKQFGRIVGSYQAVKHLCAEMVAELEPCRALIWYGAHCLDALPEDAAIMSAHAKSLVDEAGRFVARTATEVHGGIGFTDLMGLHFWFKRIGLDRQLLGGPEHVRAEIAAMLGWGSA